MKIYGIKNCISVRRALNYLDALDFEYEFIDYKKNPLDETTLRQIIENIGLDIIFNYKSKIFQSLKLSENLTDDRKMKLILEYPSIMKRPLLIRGNFVLVGFKEEEYQNLK